MYLYIIRDLKVVSFADRILHSGAGIFLLCTTTSRSALGPTQPPVQWVLRALLPGVKWPGHEADHTPPSNSTVKNAWGYTWFGCEIAGTILLCDS